MLICIRGPSPFPHYVYILHLRFATTQGLNQRKHLDDNSIMGHSSMCSKYTLPRLANNFCALASSV